MLQKRRRGLFDPLPADASAGGPAPLLHGAGEDDILYFRVTRNDRFCRSGPGPVSQAGSDIRVENLSYFQG